MIEHQPRLEMDVPLSSAADSAQNPTDEDQPVVLGEWDCKANDVITFKLGTAPPFPIPQKQPPRQIDVAGC